MIVLPRQESEKNLAIAAAVRRGIADLQPELQRIQAGFAGEKYIDRQWQQMRIADEYYLLHDYFVRLPNESTHQIDTIFLCRNFILSIEIKNIVGRIDFEQEKHQFFRTMEDGTIQGFRNPIDQVVRHQRWIASFVKGAIPVEYAVVFSNPKTIIGKTSGANIFHASGLESHINRLIHNHSKQRTSEELQKIIRDLLAIKCEPFNNFEVNRLMLRKGVLCKHCDYQFTMQFRYGKFECFNCLVRSNESLVDGLEDYRLLISEWISNQAFRDFFEINSADASKRLLKSLNLQYRGTFKNREYKICPKKVEIKL